MRGLTFDSAHFDRPPTARRNARRGAKVRATILAVTIIVAAIDFAAYLVVDSQHRALNQRIHSVETEVFQ